MFDRFRFEIKSVTRSQCVHLHHLPREIESCNWKIPVGIGDSVEEKKQQLNMLFVAVTSMLTLITKASSYNVVYLLIYQFYIVQMV